MTKKEKFLKKIHHFIYRFGIDISLVKKEEIIDAIEYNSIENANKYWASQKTKEVWDSEEYKEFYSLLIEAIAPYKLPLENNVKGKKFQTGKIQDRALWALIYGSAL